MSIENYEAFFEQYGLRYCLESAASYLQHDEIYLLVAAGFDSIPETVRAELKERRINIVDVSGITQSLMEKLPYLEKVSGLKLYLKICFLRHLIFEEYFSGEGVFSFDADVIWRIDPYELASYWTGGSFVFDGSPCLTFAKTGEWFRQYRSGLERWCTDPEFGLSFEDPGLNRSGVLHDQDLIQHLIYSGLLDQDWQCPRAHPVTAQMAMFANPLAPEQGVPSADRFTGSLVFSRTENAEFLNGRRVPFWHMQTSFSKYLGYFLMTKYIFGKRYRIPFPAGDLGDLTLGKDLLSYLHNLIITNQIKNKKIQFWGNQVQRGEIYKAFFETDLPFQVFQDDVWWKSDVFPPVTKPAA